ncbi:MAG: hypothetical protein F4077_08555, partial [Gammaproteobacteria bacterium]|nr:hypothetical protein [Gammaproteobacteria bacterium]
MRQTENRTSQLSRVPNWIWISVIGLPLTVLAIVCVLSFIQNRTSINPVALEKSKLSTAVPSSLTNTEPVIAVVESSSQLPRLDFPLGSVEEACGFNDLPPYYSSTFDSEWDLRKPLAVEECWSAMESHVGTINPFLVDIDTEKRRPFQFVVMEER